MRELRVVNGRILPAPVPERPDHEDEGEHVDDG